MPHARNFSGKFDVHPIQDADGWVGYYSSYTKNLIGDLILQLEWEGSEGYKVSFAGRTLKQRYKDIADAKKWAIRLAKAVLNNATQQVAELEAACK